MDIDLDERKPLIVLKALLQGHQIATRDGYEYAISDDHRVCTTAERICGEKREDILIVSDMSLNAFIKMCMKMPDGMIAGIAADVALTGEKRSRAKRREATDGVNVKR